MSQPTEQTTYITTSGSLLSETLIESLRALNAQQPGTSPDAFDLPWLPEQDRHADIEENIGEAWELLCEQWDTYRRDFPDMDVSTVRSRWLMPLFQLLDFDPVYQRGDTLMQDGNLRFPLSHRGWGEDITVDRSPVLHMLAPSQSLDKRQGTGRGMKAKSSHDMLQTYLNISPDQWAVLTNGRYLRLLRDYYLSYTKGYVQFDLEAIFETRSYADFRALYRLCHASRFVRERDDTDDDEAITPLERFFKISIATGIKAGEDLRSQVRDAIETLGNGFLDGELIATLQDDPRRARRYYREILQLIYRILFLLYAEQRGMMPRNNARLKDVYRQHYSITSLRSLAEGDVPTDDRNTDLWAGLEVLFSIVRDGSDELGVYAYNGMLFESNGNGDRPSLLEGRTCDNSDLLHALRSLTLIQREGVLQRISYASLDVEELGAIYESLLDFTPRVSTQAEDIDGRAVPPNTFFLDPRGMERKSTGSYYTHDSLVNELIKSALLPVMRRRLANAEIMLPVVPEDDIGTTRASLLRDYVELSDRQRRAGEKAILGMTVCDPAAGSGHFLVKANNVMAIELARIRTATEYPDDADVQVAKRDVLAHCIYAVDLNRMAVELCKVSLWINASVPDKPLNFLDHHIKCGNSLVGATPEVMKDGIPYKAFALGRTGDDHELAKRIRKRNRQERRDFEKGGGHQIPMALEARPADEETQIDFGDIEELAQTDPKKAQQEYEEYHESQDYQDRKRLADCWTAAFFWKITDSAPWVPTFGEFRRLRDEGAGVVPKQVRDQIESLANRLNFFHWHLEFEDVFNEDGSGGFDVVLGNPPWERIKLQEKEFFADKAPEIANASTAAKRKKMVRALPKDDPTLYQQYRSELHHSECLSTYLRESGLYPLTAAGDINTYAVFASAFRRIVASSGRAGIIVPTGIATDYTYRKFFSDLVDAAQLDSLFDFENHDGLFPEVHREQKFCLLTITGANQASEHIDFVFFAHQTQDLSDPERRFELTREDLRRINPNTGNCPIFRDRRDADITRKMYQHIPVLVNKAEGNNPWGVQLSTMFHMTNDSDAFHTQEELQTNNAISQGNNLVVGDRVYIPLYEGKMTQIFDHRAATFEGLSREEIAKGQPRPVSNVEHASDDFIVLPRYWVRQSEFPLASESSPLSYWLTFHDIANPNNERTFIATLCPPIGLGNTLPMVTSDKSGCFGPQGALQLLANWNTFVFDYVSRLKIGSRHFNFYIIKQLPVIPPDRYTPDLLTFIVPRVLELTYTAWDLAAFADDVWNDADESLREAIEAQWWANSEATNGGHLDATPPSWVEHADVDEQFPCPPFMWDQERRKHLRVDLDALYAHLYGLTREELGYILETFPIVKRKDENRFGEYRTKRLILERFDAISTSVPTGDKS